MGRFDELINLDEKKPQKPETAPVVQSSPLPQRDTMSVSPTPHAAKKQLTDGKKLASPHSRTSAKMSQSPALSDSEKVEKYTTHLEPSLVKKIQIEAIEKDINDYDVVRIALKEYFTKNK